MNKDFIFVSCISLSITILKHSFWCVYRVNNFSQWSRCTASFFLLFYEGLDWGAGFSVISGVFGDFVVIRVHFADLRSCLSVKKKKRKRKNVSSRLAVKHLNSSQLFLGQTAFRNPAFWYYRLYSKSQEQLSTRDKDTHASNRPDTTFVELTLREIFDNFWNYK